MAPVRTLLNYLAAAGFMAAAAAAEAPASPEAAPAPLLPAAAETAEAATAGPDTPPPLPLLPEAQGAAGSEIAPPAIPAPSPAAAASPMIVSPPLFPATAETVGAATAEPEESAQLPPLPEAQGAAGPETDPPAVPAPSPAAASEAGRPGPFPVPPEAPGEAAGRTAQPPASLLPSTAAAGSEPGAGEPASPGGENLVETAPPASRLIRMLLDGPAERIADDRAPGLPGPTAAPGAGPAVFGCPRGMLTALLAGATERSDAASALAIERETLTLCRERQEIVTRIFQLEEELRALLGKPEESPAAAAPIPAGGADAPPRAVSHLGPPGGTGPFPPSREAAAPLSYAWFSIIGTPGRLRAGVSDGTRAWFVREGDRLPGAGAVERIAARPPGVHAGGAALPYGPRPSGEGS